MRIKWGDRVIEAPITAGDMRRSERETGHSALTVGELSPGDQLAVSCAVVWSILKRHGFDISLDDMMDQSPLTEVLEWVKQFHSELNGDIEPPSNPPTATLSP